MNSSVVRLAQAKVDQDVVEISLTDTQILGCYPVFFEPWQHGGEESLQYFKRLWVMWVDVQTSFCPACGQAEGGRLEGRAPGQVGNIRRAAARHQSGERR